MKHKFHYLQSLVAVLLCVVLAMAFTSCSNDDDEPENGSLAGTSWLVTSCVSDEDGESDDEIVGVTLTFNKDGNLKFSVPTDWTYSKWVQNGNTLKIMLGEDEADDYMEGTFTINGKNATYKYAWYDVEGKWGAMDPSTMTLTKK